MQKFLFGWIRAIIAQRKQQIFPQVYSVKSESFMHINTHSQQLCEAWNYFQSLLYNWKFKTKHTDQFQVTFL